MTGILIFQSIAGGAYVLVVTIVAVRLLLLARRTRQLPELMLGTCLLIGGTFGATIEGASMTTTGEISPETAGAMLLVGKSLGLIGMTIQALFIRTVFRPESRGARAVVFAVFVCIAVPMVGFWSDGTFATGQLSIRWQWPQFFGRLICPIWMFGESVRYYALMKRRVALDLASPIVANRFLLWSISSMTGLVVLATSIPPTLLDPIRYSSVLSVDLLLFSVAGIATATCYWLALMPPPFYRRRFESEVSRA